MKERDTRAISRFEEATNPKLETLRRSLPSLPVRVLAGRQYTIDIHSRVFRDLDMPGKVVSFDGFEGWQLTCEPLAVNCPFCDYGVVSSVDRLLEGEECPRCSGAFNAAYLAGWDV